MDFDNDFFIQAQGVIERTLRAARTELLALHGHVAVDIKQDNTPVTDLDKKLEAQLREALLGFDTSIGIEGEELGIEGNRETFWLVDPIDGTENFVRGLPFVRNMVTLINNGEPIFALVYLPIADDLFVAAKGDGVYRNGQPVHVSQRSPKRAWIELSTPLQSENIPVVTALLPHIAGYRMIGDFTYAVQGKIEGQLIYGSGGGPWDYAPRALLMKEAGGIVQNIGSDSYNYRNSNMFAASPEVFEALKPIIDKAAAD